MRLKAWKRAGGCIPPKSCANITNVGGETRNLVLPAPKSECAAEGTGPEFDRHWLSMKQDLIHEKTMSAERD